MGLLLLPLVQLPPVLFPFRGEDIAVYVISVQTVAAKVHPRFFLHTSASVHPGVLQLEFPGADGLA